MYYRLKTSTPLIAGIIILAGFSFVPVQAVDVDSLEFYIKTADVKYGGTDDQIYVKLNNNHKSFLAVPKYDDFERGDGKKYQLSTDYVDTHKDILKIEIGKEGTNGWCLEKFILYGNGDEVFEKTFSPCHWFDNEPAKNQKRVWSISGPEFLDNWKPNAFVERQFTPSTPGIEAVPVDPGSEEVTPAPKSDIDNDKITDDIDNCPFNANPSQQDTDGDEIGDACDSTPTGDTDGDNVDNAVDNCPTTSNPSQQDTDGDGKGDECDSTPEGLGAIKEEQKTFEESLEPVPQLDYDKDGVPDVDDNCQFNVNPSQRDTDGDEIGDACDPTPGSASSDNYIVQSNIRIRDETGKALPNPTTGQIVKVLVDLENVGDSEKGYYFLITPDDFEDVVERSYTAQFGIKEKLSVGETETLIVTLVFDEPGTHKIDSYLLDSIPPNDYRFKNFVKNPDNHLWPPLSLSFNVIGTQVPGPIDGPGVRIPSHVRDAASLWINDRISNERFVDTYVEFIVNENIDTTFRPPVGSAIATTYTVPEWTRQMTYFWVDGQTSDHEYSQAVVWLLEEDLIKLIEDTRLDLEEKIDFTPVILYDGFYKSPFNIRDDDFPVEGTTRILSIFGKDSNPENPYDPVATKSGERKNTKQTDLGTISIHPGSWSSIVSFVIKDQPYILSYDKHVGTYTVDCVYEDKLPEQVKQGTWHKDVTHFTTFELDGQPFLFSYKATKGTAFIDSIRGGGCATDGVWLTQVWDDDDWRHTWTHFTTFQLDGHPHLLRYSGEVDKTDIKISHIAFSEEQSITLTTVFEDNWKNDWKNFVTFYNDDIPYLFAYRGVENEIDTKIWQIKKAHANFLYPDTIKLEKKFEENWSNSWTHFSSFQINGEPYIFGTKSEQIAAIHRIEFCPDGTIWNDQIWYDYTVNRGHSTNRYTQLVTYPGVEANSNAIMETTLGLKKPDETWCLTASEDYEDSYGKGQAYVYKAHGNSGKIYNPVILMDGVDFHDVRNRDDLYIQISQEPQMIDKIREKGYDVIVLNFEDGDGNIKKNANVVKELLQKINREKDSTSDKQNVIIGPSMGGLVTRYALLDMENKDQDHNVRLFISFDAPQKGAYIPLGIQYMIKYLSSGSPGAADMAENLQSDAAKQLLVYHENYRPGVKAKLPDGWTKHLALFGASGTRTDREPVYVDGFGPDSLHTSIFQDLEKLGDYPIGDDPEKYFRMIAIANGNGMAKDQGFDPGDMEVKWQDKDTEANIGIYTWALEDGELQKIFKGTIDPWGRAFDFFEISVDNTKSYDNAPCGWRATAKQVADEDTNGKGDILNFTSHECFIPTISSLAINTEDLFYNIDANKASLKTPFDEIYYPSANQMHMRVTEENVNWFLCEISAETEEQLLDSLCYKPTIFQSAG